tara:strand:- start:307 stop:516 length:210 start_codon:yes stop_codon:yes gene_type:complete
MKLLLLYLLTGIALSYKVNAHQNHDHFNYSSTQSKSNVEQLGPRIHFKDSGDESSQDKKRIKTKLEVDF